MAPADFGERHPGWTQKSPRKQGGLCRGCLRVWGGRSPKLSFSGLIRLLLVEWNIAPRSVPRRTRIGASTRSLVLRPPMQPFEGKSLPGSMAAPSRRPRASCRFVRPARRIQSLPAISGRADPYAGSRPYIAGSGSVPGRRRSKPEGKRRGATYNLRPRPQPNPG